jgi:hypothetical protein
MRDEVQQRPVVYPLVIMPILVVGGVGLIAGLLLAYTKVTGVPLSAVPDLNGLLISLPAFFLWIPVSLLLGNVVLYCVAPFRRNVEQYVADTGRPGFIESQKLLLKVFVVFAVICVPSVVLGFVL